MSFDLLIQILFLFFFCLVLAAYEVQIEGGAGWARNLPTWRPSPLRWYSRAYGRIMSGRELTGYHLGIFLIVFAFLHYPYFAGKEWAISAEFTTLSFFFIITIIWDFLWFVINPYFDFVDFWQKKVSWHKKWFLHLPTDYWFALIISSILYVKIPLKVELLKEWLLIIALFLVLTLIVTVAADLLGVFVLKKRPARHRHGAEGDWQAGRKET